MAINPLIPLGIGAAVLVFMSQKKTETTISAEPKPEDEPKDKIDIKKASKKSKYYPFESIKQVQLALVGLGFTVGKYSADGIFGNDTRLAMQAFQKYAHEHYGIQGEPHVTNQLDQYTQDLLWRAVNDHNNGIWKVPHNNGIPCTVGFDCEDGITTGVKKLDHPSWAWEEALDYDFMPESDDDLDDLAQIREPYINLVFNVWLGEGKWDFVQDSELYMKYIHPWHANMNVEGIAKIKENDMYAWFLSAYDGYSPEVKAHIWTVYRHGIEKTEQDAEKQLLFAINNWYQEVHGSNPGEEVAIDPEFLIQPYPWWGTGGAD